MTIPNPMQVPIVDTNLLPLETWRRRVGYNPWHFWQLAGSLVPLSSACNSLVYQYAWQNADASGRDDIIQAIIRAETRLLGDDGLRFAVAPRYREVEIPYPRFPKPNIQRLGYAGSDYRWEGLRLPEGYVQALGVEAFTLITDRASVVYSDVDIDGLKEKFTITVATTVTNPREIAVYFGAAERDNDPISNRWRIQPVKVSIAGGVATITGYRWQMVKPVMYEGVNTEAIDPLVDSNFASTVDVYRRYTNQDGLTNTDCQMLFVWETPPYPQLSSSFVVPAPYGLDPAGFAFAIGRGEVRDSRNGIVAGGEAIYDASTGTWNAVPWYASAYKYRPPDKVIIRYLAGYPTDSMGNMQESMAAVVEALSCAELTRRICACEEANRQLYHWQFDLARTAGAGGELFGAISREDLNNPFGTRRGQVYAFKNVKRNRVLGGFVP